MKTLSLMLTSIVLASCSSSPPPPQTTSPAPSSWTSQVDQRANTLKSATTIESAKIPVLKSSLESGWGKPSIEVSSEGGYRLTYTHPSLPFTRLLIYGYSTPLPATTTAPDASGEDMVNGELAGINVPQSWRHGTVKGVNIRWFQESLPSGADGAYWSTEGFTLTAPSGKKGYYRVVTEGSEGNFTTRLQTLGW